MITADLRIPGDLCDAMLADVAGRTEWAGYLLCGILRGAREVLLGREWHPVPAAMQLTGTGHGFSWHPDFDVQMLNRMQREGLAGVIVHYHGGTRPRLSGDDRATAASLSPGPIWSATFSTCPSSWPRLRPAGGQPRYAAE